MADAEARLVVAIRWRDTLTRWRERRLESIGVAGHGDAKAEPSATPELRARIDRRRREGAAEAALLGRWLKLAEEDVVAAEVALRAKRRAAELLKAIPRERGGDQRTSQTETTAYQQVLRDSGTPKPTASRWQAIASVPEERAS